MIFVLLRLCYISLLLAFLKVLQPDRRLTLKVDPDVRDIFVRFNLARTSSLEC